MENTVEPEHLNLLGNSETSEFKIRLNKLREQPPIYKTTF